MAEPFTPATHDDPPRRRRSRLHLLWQIPLLLVLLLVLAGVVLHSVAKHRVDTRLAAIRQAGEPTTLEELQQWYATPADNAADWIEPLIASIDLDIADDTPLPPIMDDNWAIGMPLTDAHRQTTQALLDLHDSQLTRLREADWRNVEARYPVDLAQGLDTLLPHYGQLRTTARLLALHGLMACDRGDVDDALRDVEVIRGLGRTLDREPILICFLVDLSLDEISRKLAQHILLTADLTDPQLQRLQAIVQSPDRTPQFVRALAGERGLGLGTFFDDRLGFMGNPPSLLSAVWKGSGVKYLDESAGIDAYNLMIDSAARPYDQAPDIEQYIDNLPVIYLCTRIMVPPLDVAFATTVRYQAANDLAVLTIAAKRYQLKYGRWPARLDELAPEFVPDVPNDPFSPGGLSPYRYEPRPGGVILYSLGKDGVDDAGVRYGADGEEYQPGTDIVFECPTAAGRMTPQFPGVGQSEKN